MRWYSRGVIVFGAVAFVAFPASAETTLTEVRFHPGQSSAKLDGALVRGDSAIYSFSAAAGQTADITITSLEDNAGFTIYQPPAQITHSGSDADVDGSTLQVDGKAWRGELPASGDYYIQVGGDRGNATYTLTVNIE
jgi:hypothetical protein